MANVLSATSFILWQAGTSATPLVLAGYGELVAQRAGVINVGIEGVMLMGAMCACAAATYTGASGAGLLAAAGVGLLFAAVFAFVCIWCRADQVVAGTAINLLAGGASATIWTVLREKRTEAVQYYLNEHWQWLAGVPGVRALLFEPYLDRITLPGVGAIPLVGRALANQYAMTYVVAAMGVALWWLLRRTRGGLVIQALGDAPDACDAAGIRVRWRRTACVLFAGACAGVAGSFLSIMSLHDFNVNMTDGRGFLVLSLVIFGRWNLLGLALGTVMFGAIDGLQIYLAAIPGATEAVPNSLFSALPYVCTLIALAVLTRSSAGPIHLGRPWPGE